MGHKECQDHFFNRKTKNCGTHKLCWDKWGQIWTLMTFGGVQKAKKPKIGKLVSTFVAIAKHNSFQNWKVVPWITTARKTTCSLNWSGLYRCRQKSCNITTLFLTNHYSNFKVNEQDKKEKKIWFANKILKRRKQYFKPSCTEMILSHIPVGTYIKIYHIPCDRKRVQPGTLVHVPVAISYF